MYHYITVLSDITATLKYCLNELLYQS